MITTELPVDARKSERGFTLVELMVVVAIIALLAAIVIPNYVHARAQAAVSQSEANLKQIATALELYYADNQAYPATAQNVTPALFTTTTGTNPYMTATPTNALGRGQYAYAPAPGTGGQLSYKVDDPGDYDPSTLVSIPQKGGAALCVACTTLHYTPQTGIYGT